MWHQLISFNINKVNLQTRCDKTTLNLKKMQSDFLAEAELELLSQDLGYLDLRYFDRHVEVDSKLWLLIVENTVEDFGIFE